MVYFRKIEANSILVDMEHWIHMIDDIEENYDKYDAFIIVHGTDTMAHTASALSFMIENLTKPIVITGSQVPIAVCIKKYYHSNLFPKLSTE